jgi:hypothetical protein
MLFEYFSEHDFVVEKTRFWFAGATYGGKGFLHWTPKEGWRLDLLVQRHGPSLKKYEIPALRIVTRSSYVSLPMRLQGGFRAVAPNIVLDDYLGIIDHNRLSLQLASVVLITRNEAYREMKPTGTALLAVNQMPIFEGKLEKEERVDGVKISESQSVYGFRHDSSEISLVGSSDSASGEALRIGWDMESEKAHVQDAWSFADAIKDSLAVLSGQSVQLLAREVCGLGVRRVELRRKFQVSRLGLLSLFPPSGRLPTDAIMRLTAFFQNKGHHTDLCRRIFGQMVEASQQNTLAARELLCATILEAFIRMLYGIPFKKKLSHKQYLKRLMQDYFSPSWEVPCQRILSAFNNLRQRNAHPDWLATSQGSESREMLCAATDDMIMLSRFYGYVILALAGFRPLEPRFPRPCANWGPIMTHGQDESANEV